jgi:hypothetical protein
MYPHNPLQIQDKPLPRSQALWEACDLGEEFPAYVINSSAACVKHRPDRGCCIQKTIFVSELTLRLVAF